ncbi:hypothetical protein BC940DRAFT_322217 [Gongronella butleri]|nr:hypothetical protein BC940DRAFT_322217 [Gongronella butleri]
MGWFVVFFSLFFFSLFPSFFCNLYHLDYIMLVQQIAKSCFKPSVACRHASVVASSFPSSSASCDQAPDLPYIVTPGSAPLTTPSNNAFHPSFIPKKTQVRLTLEELREVLDESKHVLHHLRQVDALHANGTPFSAAELQEQVEQLTKEQLKLMQSLQGGKKDEDQ